MKSNFIRSMAFVIGLTFCSVSLIVPQAAFADDITDIVESFVSKKLILKVKSVRVLKRTTNHVLKEIILENDVIGKVTLYKRDPTNSYLVQWPTAFVLSGLGTSLDTIRLIPDAGLENVSFVVLSYPFDQEPTNPDEVTRFAESVPLSIPQIVATFLWLEQQSDVRADKIVSLNVSYGSFIAPLAFRILADLKHYPSQTIFAFGGADLEPFVTAYVRGSETKRLATRVARILNPNTNLKRLHGPFLVVDGALDDVIPKASSDSLFNDLSEPKTRVSLDVGHIGTRKPDIVQQMLKVVSDWLSNFP